MPAYGAVGLTIVLWASSFAAIRAAVPHYGPLGLTGSRLLTASLAFALLAPAVRLARPAQADLKHLLLAGLLGMSGYQVLLNAGQTRVTAATASVIIATSPVLTSLVARIALGERLTARRLGGAGVAFAGVAIAAVGEGSGIRVEAASLLVLAAALTQSAYFVVLKSLLVTYRPIEATAWATWMGALTALPLLTALPWPPAHVPTQAHLAVLFLGVGASALGFFMWSVALRQLDASAAAVYLYLIPPTAALVAWLWLGELPTPLAVVGGVVTLAGVGLAQLRPRSLVTGA